jgi:tRNA G10  N-methylase Trm11
MCCGLAEGVILLCCDGDTIKEVKSVKEGKTLTVKLNIKAFEENQIKYKLNEERKCAEKMEISPSQLWKVKTGIHDPGKDFIAGALKAFPQTSFDELFFLPGVLRERDKFPKCKAG